jgi:CRISPR/Cas system-associated protein endoribonuclease Cas2
LRDVKVHRSFRVSHHVGNGGFDCPVLTKQERARATKFTPGKEKADALAAKVGAEVPPGGKVDIVFFTDAQYGSIKSFRGRGQSARPGKPD